MIETKPRINRGNRGQLFRATWLQPELTGACCILPTGACSRAKETVVLRRWGVIQDNLVLSTELIM